MPKKRNCIGFIHPPKQKAVGKNISPKEDALITFDSGNTISFADASHHTLVVGATGCGKTAQVTTPAMKSMLKAGFAGLILDIKGNVTSQVRSLANECGREGDIEEIGSENPATSINVMKHMIPLEAYQFFTNLIEPMSSEHDNNRNFHMKGVNIAKDCFELLHIMMQTDATFTPNFVRIAEMLSSYEESTAFFANFVLHKKSFVSEAYPLGKINIFIKKIRGNAHHVFNFPDTDSIIRSSRSSYIEQLNYALGVIRIALDELLMSPGVVQNFACMQSSATFNMQDIYTKNKVIILRFSPASGPAGVLLTRYMVEEYYKAVFKYGMSLPKDRYTFICYDEFQAFADLSERRYSDASFVAQAREFRNISLFATQSLSSLITRQQSALRVAQFVANCNTRIVFYSDDPTTQNMVDAYDSRVRLNALDGKAFVIQYNAKKRQHTHQVEGLQNSFESTSHLLALTAPTEPINMEIGNVSSVLTSLTRYLQNMGVKKSQDLTLSSSILPFRDHMDRRISEDITPKM